MAKPPPGADPEKFIIGQGTYTNVQIARPCWDDQVFRIEPIPMPVRWIVIINLILVAVGFGCHCFLKNVFGELGPLFYYGAPLGATLLICGGLTAGLYGIVADARRSGPWLIYDRATGQVELPRERVMFSRREIVHLQYVTTKRLGWGIVMSNDRQSELNLITNRDGVRKRWPLLKSTLVSNAFDYILKPLVENTDLPVLRVQDGTFGWRITETPYGRTIGKR